MHRPVFAGCFGDCEPTSVEDANVRYGSLADIIQRIRNVRFTLNSGHAPPDHQCPLSARSGHRSVPNLLSSEVLRQ